MEYSMCACHFRLLPELWIIFFDMWSHFMRWKWGMEFFLFPRVDFQCYIFWEWCNMTKHFTSKLKMYNCLITSKSHVAFRDVSAVPLRYSKKKLFTVNKVAFIVKVIFTCLTMLPHTPSCFLNTKIKLRVNSKKNRQVHLLLYFTKKTI